MSNVESKHISFPLAGEIADYPRYADRFFHLYRDVGGAIYPVLPDITLFEKKLETLLQNRESSSNRQQGVSGSDQLFSVDLSFLALLFAVLASGCQSSDLSKDERELMAQVFGKYLTIPKIDLYSTARLTLHSVLLLPVSSHD